MQSITSSMGELRMEEMSLPALFEQARKIHFAASESTVDQVNFLYMQA